MLLTLDITNRAECATWLMLMKEHTMKPLCCFVVTLGLFGFASTVQTGAQVPPFQGRIESGPAWDKFVQQVLERVRAEEIPPATEREPETLESPSYRPESENDSREALAELVASMMQALAPDLLPPGYRFLERDPRILDLLHKLPADFGTRGDGAFEKAALRALADVHRALSDVFKPDGSSVEALKGLQQAVRDLDSAREITGEASNMAFVDDVARRIVGVGELMAKEAIAHADAAGVEKAVLTEAELALARSIEAVASGRYGDAIREQLISVEAGAIPILDLNRFEQRIIAAMHGKTVGFAYAIASGGFVVRAGAEGYARMPADGQVAQSPLKEMNIASTSKTLTAMTLLQLLAEKGVSVDDHILPWLPESWTKGPGIEFLTFRGLLDHRSGLNSNADGPYENADLRAYIAAGINGVDTIFPHYQNTNYAMFRVIIPFLHYGPQVMNMLDAEFAGVLDPFLNIAYRDIVRERVLAKTGVVEGDCKPAEITAAQTLMYEFPYLLGNGVTDRNWMSRCGSGGWYFSAAEMATILATRRHTNAILPPDAKRQMDTEFLGWYPIYGVRGVYRWHNGGLAYSGGRGLNTCWMDYTFGVQAALFSNSIGGHDDACSILQKAFDGAFVDPHGFQLPPGSVPQP
jgi:beta-lactamase family protein